MIGLEIKFINDDSEIIQNVEGYVVSGEDNTLRVDIKGYKPILYNFEYVQSVRYIEVDEDPNVDEELTDKEAFKKMMERFFDGII